MPFLDRYWWLRPILAITILVAGAFLIVPLISDEMDLERDGFGVDTFTYAIAGVASLVFLAFAIGLGVSTFSAMNRKRRRLAVIAGNTSAMSLAPLDKAESQANLLPDVASEPLSLQWRLTNRARVTSGLNIAAGLLSVGSFVLIGIAVFVALIAEAIQGGAFTQRDRLIPVVGLVDTVIIVGFVIAVRLAWNELQSKPFGVIAQQDGIACRTQLGRATFLRWEDIRLFEVSKLGLLQPTARSYRLYTNRNSAVWNYNPLSLDIVPADIGAAEMSHRIQLLVEVIHAHTGLYPRTFSKALQAFRPPALPETQRSHDTIIAILALGLVNGLVIAFAASLLLVPFSDSPTLNAIAAGPLFAFMLVEVGLLLARRRLRPRGRMLSSSTTPEPMRVVPAPESELEHSSLPADLRQFSDGHTHSQVLSLA